jgi:hypothetical protein
MLGARVSNTSTVLEPGGKVIIGTSQNETSGPKGVTFNGVYVVAWVGGSNTSRTRPRSSGALR